MKHFDVNEFLQNFGRLPFTSLLFLSSWAHDLCEELKIKVKVRGVRPVIFFESLRKTDVGLEVASSIVPVVCTGSRSSIELIEIY